MSAFNDPQKLADAVALARSFKSGEFADKKQRNKTRPIRVEGMFMTQPRSKFLWHNN